MKNYPICYEQPMNALVVSEVMMWNSLFKVMKNDICNYKNMLNQFNTMNWSNDFECLANNKVPQGWIRRSIKTIKPLPQWMMKVERKMNYMRNWVKNGQPMCIDISMLINPNTFFMCIKQCCIRKNWEIMRKVHIECKPMKMSPEKFSKMPQEGFYVCGMWMQGGCWDYNNMRMMNVEQNMIQNRMPVFHMIPVYEKEAVHEGKCCIPLYCEQEWKNQVRTYPNKAIMLEIPTEVKNNECVMKNMSMFLEQCI